MTGTDRIRGFIAKTAAKRAILDVLGAENTQKTAENAQKTAENAQNWPKSSKNRPKTVKMAENCPKTVETAENCLKTPKNDENRRKRAKKGPGDGGSTYTGAERLLRYAQTGNAREFLMAFRNRGVGASEYLGFLGKSAESGRDDDEDVDFGDPVDVSFRDGRTGRRKCSVSLELADTPERRARGLSKRAALADGHGMFFDCRGPFWMKDVEFPLDLVFTDSSGRVTEKTAMPVDKKGSRLHSAHDPDSENAVELPYGFCSRHGVSVGDYIDAEDQG